MERKIFLYLLLLMGVIAPSYQGNEDCGLDGYEAHCVLDIMDEHIEATAIVNHCHVPLDITFRVIYRYGNGTDQRWQYTFVTSNQNERVLIPGLTLPPAPYALVYLYVRVPQSLFDLHNDSIAAVEASFVAILSDDTWEEAEFLNEVITVDTLEDCFAHEVESNDYILWIIGGTILGILCVGVATAGVLWWYRRKKIAIDELALVSSLETGLPGAQPYQIGPSDQNCINNNILKNSPKPGHSEDSKAQTDSSKKGKLGYGFNRLNEDSVDVVKERMAKKLGKAVVIGNPVLVDKTSLFKNRFNRLSPLSSEGAKVGKKVEAVGDAFENSYSVEIEGTSGQESCKQSKDRNLTQITDNQQKKNNSIRSSSEEKEEASGTFSVGARPKEKPRTPPTPQNKRSPSLQSSFDVCEHEI